MSASIIQKISGRGVVVLGNDVDTDRVIPARFMKCVTFDDLGKYLFYDVRFTSDGKSTGHALDDARFQGASIMVVGRNFGCGSSREHAPQAIRRFGFAALVGESFAEIFADNCVSIGLAAVTASAADLKQLSAFIEQNPTTPLTLDLATQQLHFGNQQIPIRQPESARKALTEGLWDSTQTLLSAKKEVQEVASRLPYNRWGRSAANRIPSH